MNPITRTNRKAHTMRLTSTGAVLAAASIAVFVPAQSALAQSASVALTASNNSPAPGDTIVVSVVATYDTAGAPAGMFGGPGLFGFGGDVDASGPSAADCDATSPVVSGSFTSGVTTSLMASPALVQAAGGRTLASGGLAGGPVTVLSFDLTIDPGASAGSATLTYDGSVVLALGDVMQTYATSPGVGQGTLSVTDLVLTIGGSAYCVADVNTTNTNPGDPGYGEPDGTVNGADLSYYVEQWLNLNAAVADVNTTNTNPGDPGYGQPDGTVNGADLSYFVEQWLAGNAGAGCP